MKFGTMLVVVGTMSMVISSVAQAFPSKSDCAKCHGGSTSGKMEVTGEDALLDLGTQLDGEARGELKTFEVIAGDIVTLSMNVLDGSDYYAPVLERLETGGQLNDLSNRLVWSNANAGDNVWPQRGTTTDPYFTKDDNGWGIIWGGTPVTYTFDLFVDASTPLDIYNLLFAVAGVYDEGPKWYGEEYFYVQVIPEPATLMLLGIGGALMNLTRKRRFI